MNAIEFRRQLVAVGIKAGLDVEAALAAAKKADGWCVEGGTRLEIRLVERPPLAGPMIAHEPPGGEPAPDPAPARPRGRPKRSKPVRPMGRTPKAGGLTIQDRVYAAIEAAGAGGISRADVARQTKLDAGQVGPAAQKLRDDKRIAVVGRTVKARYVSTKFRPQGAQSHAGEPPRPMQSQASSRRAKGASIRASAVGASAHAGKGVNGGMNSEAARGSAAAPESGGNGATPLAVPAATPVAAVRDAIAAAAGGGISRTALATRVGLDAVALDGAITACLMKGHVVERDRVLYAVARPKGRASGEAALAASPVSAPS